jgi:hypothetical protein
MKPEDLNKMMGDSQYGVITFDCCDCKEESTIQLERISETEIKITGGALFKPPENWLSQDAMLAKCQKCFDADPKFRPKAEVYSRVVGYLRPVSSWNAAKQNEFEMRKTSKV